MRTLYSRFGWAMWLVAFLAVVVTILVVTNTKNSTTDRPPHPSTYDNG